MSRKYKFDPVVKVELVERYLRNEIGLREAARLAGLASNRSFADWVSIYRNEGPAGLLYQDHNKNFDPIMTGEYKSKNKTTKAIQRS